MDEDGKEWRGRAYVLTWRMPQSSAKGQASNTESLRGDLRLLVNVLGAMRAPSPPLLLLRFARVDYLSRCSAQQPPQQHFFLNKSTTGAGKD